MEEKSMSDVMLDSLAKVKKCQTSLLDAEAEKKRLAEIKFGIEKRELLNTMINQIVMRSNHKYIIFEFPQSLCSKISAPEMITFVIKEIYNTFTKDYCMYSVVQHSGNYRCMRISTDKHGNLERTPGMMMYMLYDRRRFIAGESLEMLISSTDVKVCSE